MLDYLGELDKVTKIRIITSATPLNRNGKEPGTGALSHSIANQIKYFGLRLTRLITGLFKGVATANSNRSNWAGDFYLTQTEMTPGAYDTQGQDTISLLGRPTVKRDSTNSSAGSQNTGSSFNPQLSALLDLLIQHEETLRGELIKTKQIRRQIEEMIPNNPLKDFINDLQEI